MSATLARTVIGIIGNVISFLLFASPIPTFCRICKNKSVEEFQPYPYIGAVLNCMFWVFYGIVTPNSTLVITINGIGLAMELAYLAIFIYFSNKLRRKILLGLLGEVLFIGVVACIALLAIHSRSDRSIFVGAFSVACGLVLYASPLMIMKKVITTKSVEFMPFSICITYLFNGAIWATYALIKVPPTMKIDIFILIANGVGAMFAVAQLVLYAMYYGSTPKTKTCDDPKKSEGSKHEVQLSQV